jgi:hypothetical protein
VEVELMGFRRATATNIRGYQQALINTQEVEEKTARVAISSREPQK